MFRAIFPIFFAACAVADEKYVVELTGSNFSEYIEENSKGVLVEFYAPWCGHCQSLEPEYEKAAERLAGKTVLAKVDATKEGDLAEQFDVEGFPTIFFFRNGQKVEEYDGPRSADGIVTWLETRSGPPVVPTTLAEVDEQLEALSAGRAGFVLRGVQEGSPEHDAYLEAAEGNRKLGTFYWVTDAESSPRLSASHGGEAETMAYEGSLKNATELGLFFNQESFPLFGKIDANNYEAYAAENPLDFDLVWLCVDSAVAKKGAAVFAPAIRQLAKTVRGKYNFVYIDATEYEEHARKYLGCMSLPSIIVQTDLQGSAARFPWYLENESELTTDSLREFLDTVAGGNAEPFLRGAEAPESNDGPVKTVVTSTFKDIVLDPTKDVFLEVYAPWCGHCKKLAPVWTKLARMVGGQDGGAKVVIAQMDGTENEAPSGAYTWQGFPTLFYKRAGEEVPKVYKGPRDLPDLMSFIRTQSSFPEAKALAVLKGAVDLKELREYVDTLPQTDAVTRQIRQLLKEHDSLAEDEDDMGAAETAEDLDDLDEDDEEL